MRTAALLAVVVLSCCDGLGAGATARDANRGTEDIMKALVRTRKSRSSSSIPHVSTKAACKPKAAVNCCDSVALKQLQH